VAFRAATRHASEVAGRWFHRLRLGIVVALLAVAAPLLAACGGASQTVRTLDKSAYDQKMQTVAQRYGTAETRTFTLLTRAFAKRQKDAAVSSMRHAAALYTAESDALATIKPPNEVARDHAVLVTSYLTAGRWAAALASLVRNPKSATAATKRDARNTWLPRVNAVLRDLRAKGYEVGDFTGSDEHIAGAGH
jgi:hypothetical protein